MNYYKIPTEHVLVAYDELDLPPGRVQLRFDGSGAGHNGIGSVIEHVGTKFWRLRFGVGHPRDQRSRRRRKQVIDHVLKRARRAEETAISRHAARSRGHSARRCSSKAASAPRTGCTREAHVRERKESE